MADGEIILPLRSLPGIKRDGTRLEGDVYVDGQWCRFQRSLPRKIGGYRAINQHLSDVVRALSAFTYNNLTYVHAGSANKVERLTINGLFNTSIISDRTPTSDFTEDDANLWVFDIDQKLEAGTPELVILAQVAPNGDDLTNASGGEIFYGMLTDTTPLVTIALPVGGNATGGILAMHPYTFIYGSNGYVAWSVAGDPTDFSSAGSGAENVAANKIVAAAQLRGGGSNSPAGLFWAADALVRATFVGGDPVFAFDTISAQSSILSSRSVIEYDGVFYWAGVDRFLAFNGVVREVPNPYNLNWFYDNLNWDYRQKVFVTKVPRFGEIWWCFPFGDATEPDHAVIYNVRENIWYDTVLPPDMRSAGTFPTVFRKPLMAAPEPSIAETIYRVTEEGNPRITEDSDNRVTEESEAATYKLWIHEQGVDAIDGESIQPIESFFETADILLAEKANSNAAIGARFIEPDFVQEGDMTVAVRGRRNARAPEDNGAEITFPAVASTSVEQIVHLKTERREFRLRFSSNVIGGDYQMGTVLLHYVPGTGTVVT